MPALPNISPELLRSYQEEISKTSSPATIRRKNISLNRFFNWASDQGHIEENPMDQSPAVISTPSAGKTGKRSLKVIAISSMTFGMALLIFAFVWKAQSPIDFILNLAGEGIPESGIQTGKGGKITSLITPPPEAAPTPVPGPSEEEATAPSQTQIPAIGGAGNLILAGDSPTIDASTGDLLIEGKTVTIKTADGGDGNIEINPDGSGIAHFLFEGSGENFLNAQAPNLTKGSLYYGVVANNATGYDLLRLQSGSKPITRLSIDALGNTYIGGTASVSGQITANGIINKSAYEQTSGNFTLSQGPGDFASITKDLSSGGALSDVLTLTLDERGKPTTTNSGYSTLVLKRYDGAKEGYALFVDEGNARFDGQLQLGQFAANPDSIGPGSIIYNSTVNSVRFWNGSAWVTIGGSGLDADTLDTLDSTQFLRSDTSDNFTSGTLTTDAGTTLDVNGDLTVADTNILFDGAATAFTTTGNLTLNSGGGDVIFSDGDVFSVGQDSYSDTAYNVIADSIAGASASMNGDEDLFIQGDLEVDGTIYGAISGTVPWNEIDNPTGDLTLTMGTNNTTFNWDPGDNSAETAFSLTFDGQDTAADEDQILLALSQTVNATDSTEAADALLTFTNNDANDPVENAIRFDAGGASAPDFSDGIDFSGADLNREIVLENGEAIIGQVADTITFEDDSGTDYATLSVSAFTLPGNVRTGDGTAAAVAYGFSSEGGDTGMYLFSDNNLSLVTAATDRIFIRNDGVVGIGTTTPTTGQRLQVNGNIRSGDGTAGVVTYGFTSEGGDTGMYLFSDNKLAFSTGALDRLLINSDGTVGIGDTDPDAKLEILSTSEQLRLTNVDGTTDARFTVSATGDLTIDMLGSGTTDQLVLGDADTINIGGNASNDIVYNAIADSVAGASASMDGDEDLYVQGDLEIDGTIYGTIVGTVVWNELDNPTGDLTLTMGTNNTTFNWDPGPDSAETNFSLTTQGEDTVAGGEVDQVLLALSQTSNAVDVDQAADSLLTLTNNDLDDPVASAIRFDAGAAGTDFTYGINFDAASIGTAEIVLQNAETIGNVADDVISFGVGGSAEAALSSSALYPAADDGSALGILNTNEWSDLYLATGAVIAFDNNDVTLTHAANSLSIAGGDFNVEIIDGQIINFDGDGSPTADILQIGSGDNSATAGVDALQITFDSTNASGNAIDITLSGIDGNDADTTIGIDLDAFTYTSSAGTNIVQGVNIGTLTEAGAGATTSTALNIGSGWDTLIGGTTAGTNLFSFTNASLTTAGLLTLASNLAVNGDNITSDGNLTINATGYVRVGDTGTPITAVDDDDDLYVEGDLETVGDIYLTGHEIFNVISGTGTEAIILATNPTGPGAAGDYSKLTYGSWLVQNATNNGIAALMVDQTKGGSIFSASQSGTPRFTIANDGSIASAPNTLTTGDAFDLTATYSPTGGGTQSGIDINFTNAPSSSVNTLRGLDLAITDGTALSNTLYGTYVTVDNSGNTGAEIRSIYGGYYTATGTTSGTTTAVGLYSTATGADNNYAAIFESGRVGIGITSPLFNLHVADTSTNFGATAAAGAFVDLNSYYGDEFFKDRTQVTADGTQNWGDNLEWSTGVTNTCAFDRTNDGINGITLIEAGTTAGSYCTLSHTDLGANTADLWADPDYLPTIIMKARASAGTTDVPDSTHQYMLGIVNGTGGAVPVAGAPTSGIYFSNASDAAGTTGTANWYAVTDNNASATNTACAAIDESNFALLVIKVVSTSLVRFYYDTNVSDGISLTECGTGHTTNIDTVSMTGFLKAEFDSGVNSTALEVDFFRLWQDDNSSNPAMAENQSVENPYDPVSGADIAEIYPTIEEEEIPSGTIVSAVGEDLPFVTTSTTANDPKAIGIVSTMPSGNVLGQSYGEANTRVAIGGRVPVRISTGSRPILAGDYITSSGDGGMGTKAIKPGVVVGKALESWTPDSGKDSILVMVNLSNYDPDIYLASTDAFKIIAGNIIDDAGAAIDRVGAFRKIISADIKAGFIETADFVAQNIKSGSIATQDFAASSFTAFQGTVDNLLVKSGLVAENVQTKLISPLPDGTDVTVQIGSPEAPSGKFSIQNTEGTEVASIDNLGNAKFAGNVNSQNIDQIEALLSQVRADQSVLLAATSSADVAASESANLSELITNDLFVTNHAAISSLLVNDTLTANNLDSLSEPLRIQSLALAPIELMAGLIRIETNGGVKITGNLYVAGEITTEKGLKVQNTLSPDPLALIDASGSASFKQLTTDSLIVAGSEATISGEIINGEIQANSTIGKALIPAGATEITIRNPKVNDYSLVYVTPTSSTQNRVLYIKSKAAGYFVAGFTEAIDTDTEFNWWIVEVKN